MQRDWEGHRSRPELSLSPSPFNSLTPFVRAREREGRSRGGRDTEGCRAGSPPKHIYSARALRDLLITHPSLFPSFDYLCVGPGEATGANAGGGGMRQ